MSRQTSVSAHLTRRLVDEYLRTAQQNWPHQSIDYAEDVALRYLHLKNYDVHSALVSLLFNNGELRRMCAGKGTEA